MTATLYASLSYAAAGAAAAGLCGYLLTLAVAALADRDRTRPNDTRRNEPAHTRLAVLVPAHNEADLIGRCLASLQRQTYPQELYRVVVIADNCSDDTAEIATLLGADVLIRHDPQAAGKGRALRWAMDALLATDTSVDAFVVIDADSVVDTALLDGLAARFATGAEAVQGEYLALPEEPTPRAQLRSAAFLLFHRVRFSGRGKLGLPCNLVGNGMLFSAKLMRARPWNAFSGAEDLEFTVELRMHGVRPVFARDTRVWAPIASRGAAARTQRLRWEGGGLHVRRSRLPAVLKEIVQYRRWRLADLALDLATPPLGVLAALALTGAGVGTSLCTLRLIQLWSLTPWLFAVSALPAHVLIGLIAARAPASMYRALLHAPALMLAELATRLRLLGGTHADKWERTARPSEVRPAGAP